MLIPLMILSLAAGAWYKKSTRNKTLDKGVMSPARKIIYETALNTEKDPAKLRVLALEFEAQGLEGEGTLLRKRAALKELPPEVKEGRQNAFRKGMSSLEPPKVLKLADAFAKEGATGAATALSRYARGLETANRAVVNGKPLVAEKLATMDPIEEAMHEIEKAV